jgi:hypothetical protein
MLGDIDFLAAEIGKADVPYVVICEAHDLFIGV